jgi:hypothetical protein
MYAKWVDTEKDTREIDVEVGSILYHTEHLHVDWYPHEIIGFYEEGYPLMVYSFVDILPRFQSGGFPPSRMRVPASLRRAFPGFHSGLVLQSLHRLFCPIPQALRYGLCSVVHRLHGSRKRQMERECVQWFTR